MKKPLIFSTAKIVFCIILACATLFAVIDKQNNLTELRKEIPLLSKELKAIEAENNRLQYDIDQFESPLHLMELSRKPEFTHLKYYYDRDVIIIKE